MKSILRKPSLIWTSAKSIWAHNYCKFNNQQSEEIHKPRTNIQKSKWRTVCEWSLKDGTTQTSRTSRVLDFLINRSRVIFVRVVTYTSLFCTSFNTQIGNWQNPETLTACRDCKVLYKFPVVNLTTLGCSILQACNWAVTSLKYEYACCHILSSTVTDQEWTKMDCCVFYN